MTDANNFLPDQPALLALADGSVFVGQSIGACGQSVGELVFNTSMTGYQEILTDPSYAKQIVTLTYPHIGNVGVNPDDTESKSPWAAGLVIRENSPMLSNWRATDSLSDFLNKHRVVAISGVDTRAITRRLRDQGAQGACIMTGDVEKNREKAIAAAREFSGLENCDLASVVTASRMYSWDQASVRWGDEAVCAKEHNPECHIVVYDFGVKHQILRCLVDAGCRVTVVPAKTPLEKMLKQKPDAVLLSNGPGDPAACDYAIEMARALLEKQLPVMGICLGFQILALASGAKTFKMKFGHHGGNHPVQDLETGRVMITSQNHGFAVEEASLPDQFTVTHRSLFDGTVQGMAHKTLPVMGFQGHPEAGPGPHDIRQLFDRFIERAKA